MKEFVGKAVVSLKDGASIGRVKDVFIDTSSLTATGLLLEGDPGHGMLPLKNIKNNGKDAITVEDSSPVEWVKSVTPDQPLRLGDDVMHLTVVNSEGDVVGKAHDVVFEDGGKIECLEVTRGGVFGLGAHNTDIERAQILAIGEELITVDLK